MHALSEYEIFTKQRLSESQVETLLRKWLEWPSRGPAPFYFHSDSAATLKIQQKLHDNSAGDMVVGLQLDAPPLAYRDIILNALKSSRYHGCYYMKLLLDDPARFFMRSELPADVIRAFFLILWDKSTKAADGAPLYKKLNFVTLEGMPSEKAWIDFHGTHNCETAHRANAFKPLNDVGQVFVNHPAAADSYRQKLAKFLSSFAPGVSYEDLLARFRHRGKQTLQQAAEGMGSSVPFYTVTIE